jgi:chromosome segregation ATPase
MSEDVAAIKTAIEDTKEKLKKIENKKGSVSASIYKKVKEDYERRLEDLSGQLAGKKESLKESLKEIATKRQPLKSKLDDLQEQLEEIELRHSIGEYSDGQYESMSNEIKEKMDLIESDLEAIKKEEKETKELLGEHTKDLDLEEEIEETREEEEAVSEEEKEPEEEPLPEVAEENMIAEELFTGKEMTAEESESVVSNVSDANAEKDDLPEQQTEQVTGGEELFDFSEEESGPTEKKETKTHSAVSAEEEDWLSSLEQELNEGSGEDVKEREPEKAKNTEKAEKKPDEELVSLCPKCNYKNRPDAWYCENCGSELTSPE